MHKINQINNQRNFNTNIFDMKSRIICCIILVTIIWISCNKNEGYLEIRNQSDFTLENIKWGNSVSFKEILPGEEMGTETDETASNDLYMDISNKQFRLKESVSIDAHSSATIIIRDTSQLTKI